MLTTPQVAALLGITNRAVCALTHRPVDPLPVYRYTRSTFRYGPAEIADWIARQDRKAA